MVDDETEQNRRSLLSMLNGKKPLPVTVVTGSAGSGTAVEDDRSHDVPPPYG